MRRLYQLDDCPYCETVRRALHYFILEYNAVWITRDDRDAVRDVSGQEEVPVLTENGRVFTDSEPIVRYLEESYGSRGLLFPHDPGDRGLAKVLLRYITRVWKPLVSESRKSAGGQKKKEAALQEQVDSEARSINDLLSGRSFLLGENMTYPDLFFSGFVFMIREHSPLHISPEYQKILGWYENVNQITYDNGVRDQTTRMGT